MRGIYVPFAEETDVATDPSAYKIPQSDENSAIDPTWIDFPTPPTGGARLYGVIVERGQPIPNLSSNITALIYDKNSDQVLKWAGSKLRVIG